MMLNHDLYARMYTAAPLLRLHLAIRLNGLDVLIGIQRVNGALVELDPVHTAD